MCTARREKQQRRKSLLADFRGVLVTDFYSAYDSINCPQQKCLIHLIRDLNDDLRRNPFNEEIQEVGPEHSRCSLGP